MVHDRPQGDTKLTVVLLVPLEVRTKLLNALNDIFGRLLNLHRLEALEDRL